MVTVKDEILLLADSLTEEQLIEFSECLKKKAEEKKRARGYEAYKKFMDAYAEFRKICPDTYFWVESNLEWTDCGETFVEDIDAFGIMDTVWQMYNAEHRTPF